MQVFFVTNLNNFQKYFSKADARVFDPDVCVRAFNMLVYFAHARRAFWVYPAPIS